MKKLEQNLSLEPGDLEAITHCAFVLETSLANFLFIRNYLRGLSGVRFIHGSHSGHKFYVIHEHEWRKLKELEVLEKNELRKETG